MAYSCNILLGRITKASGYEGAVTVKLERSFIGKIPQMESVFLETDGRPVPFFVEEYEYSGVDSLRLKFRFYDSAAQVERFKGCRVFLTKAGDQQESVDSLDELENFTVFDENNNKTGIVKEVIQNPGQALLNIISLSGKELLIPLHEDLVIGFDRTNCVIRLKIPEGLTEIN